METVFSHWVEQPDGAVASKIDLIQDMQAGGYFVLLLFVGLSDSDTSVLRVMSRVQRGGHAVEEEKLRRRFPRTQKAIRAASAVADATILVDNSRDEAHAFTVCRGERRGTPFYDMRQEEPHSVPPEIAAWLDLVSPR